MTERNGAMGHEDLEGSLTRKVVEFYLIGLSMFAIFILMVAVATLVLR